MTDPSQPFDQIRAIPEFQMQHQCTICQSEVVMNYRFDNFSIFNCKNCNHRFSVPGESFDIQKEYDENYYIEKHKNWFQNPNFRLFDFVLRVLEEKKSTNILDFGCGKGDLLRYLDEKTTLNLTGIDLTQNTKSGNIKFVQGDLYKHEFNNKFDLIVSLAVIEHVDDLNSFIRKIRDLLDAQGVIIIMTVNQDSIIYKLSRLLYSINIKEPFIRLYDQHHINHFSQSSLTCLLNKHNFKIEKSFHKNHVINSLDFNKTSAAKAWIFRVAVFILFKIENITKRSTLQTIVASKLGN